MPREDDERLGTRPPTAAELREVAARARRLAREILDPPTEARVAALEPPMPGKSEPQTE